MQHYFQCKVAMIMGGAGCMAYTLVHKLFERQIKGFMLVDDKRGHLREQHAELIKCYTNNRVGYTVADISESMEIREAFNKTIKKFNQLDFVINCAGILDEKDWNIMIDSNLVGAIEAVKYGCCYISKYKISDFGTVMNVTSNLGFLPLRSLPVYSGISNYVIGSGQALGSEENLKKHCTNVVTVCMGLTKSKFLDEHQKKFAECANAFPIQDMDTAVDKLINILEHPTNGAVYEIENGKAYIIKFKDRSELKV